MRGAAVNEGVTLSVNISGRRIWYLEYDNESPPIFKKWAWPNQGLAHLLIVLVLAALGDAPVDVVEAELEGRNQRSKINNHSIP